MSDVRLFLYHIEEYQLRKNYEKLNNTIISFDEFKKRCKLNRELIKTVKN